MARRPGAGGRDGKGPTYAAAGVDVARGDRFARAIRRSMERTHGDAVLPNPGGFAGLFRLDSRVIT